MGDLEQPVATVVREAFQVEIPFAIQRRQGGGESPVLAECVPERVEPLGFSMDMLRPCQETCPFAYVPLSFFASDGSVSTFSRSEANADAERAIFSN